MQISVRGRSIIATNRKSQQGYHNDCSRAHEQNQFKTQIFGERQTESQTAPAARSFETEQLEHAPSARKSDQPNRSGAAIDFNPVPEQPNHYVPLGTGGIALANIPKMQFHILMVLQVLRMPRDVGRGKTAIPDHVAAMFRSLSSVHLHVCAVLFQAFANHYLAGLKSMVNNDGAKKHVNLNNDLIVCMLLVV